MVVFVYRRLTSEEESDSLFQPVHPKVELILPVCIAAILSWRAVACGMRSGITTGLMGR